MKNMIFSFEGRISRKQYWLFNLVFIVGLAITGVISVITMGEPNDVAFVLFILIIIWPMFAMQVKRWHDRDKSGWWVLIGIIPVLGPIWALVENGFLAGTEGNNRFGSNPLKKNNLRNQ